MRKVLQFFVAQLISFLPALIGSPIVALNIHPWYDEIAKPVFNPPAWVFAPAWTILYCLMGISLFLLLRSENSKAKIQALIVFSLQLFLNALWSIVFFGLHSVFGALLVIVILLSVIALSIERFYKVSKIAAYLFIPYFLWVSFATVLNYSIYQLNFN